MKQRGAGSRIIWEMSNDPNKRTRITATTASPALPQFFPQEEKQE